MKTTIPQSKWCPGCDRMLWEENFDPIQWLTAEGKRKCLQCQGYKTNLNFKQCIKCRKHLTYRDFSGDRWCGRKNLELICKTCIPKRTSRRIIPGQKYPCTKCHRDLPAQEFPRAAKTGPRSNFLVPVCCWCGRARSRERSHAKRGFSPEESKLRSDARYDYCFARDVLGLDPPNALAWLARGYSEVELETLESWGIATSSLPPWEPDPYIESEDLLEAA